MSSGLSQHSPSEAHETCSDRPTWAMCEFPYVGSKADPYDLTLLPLEVNEGHVKFYMN